jgi:excinuclease ABC subunit C
MMVMLRLNVPSVFIYGGSILPGNYRGKDVTIVDVFEAVGKHSTGNMSKKDLDELQLSHILILGIAKGPSRKAGMENLILSIDNEIIECDSASPALHLIQHIRDEAHRFAIMAHRQKRKKKRSRSILEEIEGIGNKRRQLLIRHFGGLQGVSKASINELAKVSGINKNLAKKIYETIHDDP